MQIGHVRFQLSQPGWKKEPAELGEKPSPVVMESCPLCSWNAWQRGGPRTRHTGALFPGEGELARLRWWCSVAHSYLTLRDPMNWNTPGFLSFTNSQSLLKLMSKKTTQLFKNLDYFFMLNNENLKTVTIGHEAKYGGPSECGVL